MPPVAKGNQGQKQKFKAGKILMHWETVCFPKKKGDCMKVKTSSDSVQVRKPGFRVLTAVVAVIIACSASTTVFALGDNKKNEKIGTAAEKSVSAEEKKNFFSGLFVIKVKADGKNRDVQIADGTVKDTLEKAGITLSKEDKVSPSLDTPINSFTKIRITRIKKRTKVVKEEIPFETEVVPSDDLMLGQSEIVKEGVNGTKIKYYSQKLMDGAVAESKLKKEVIKKKPVTEIKKVGTKSFDNLAAYEDTGYAISELEAPETLKLDKNGVPKKYKKVIRGKATAYASGTITSTGKKPMPGYIAVDPKKIPYGTELYITSADGKYVYGYCKAEDTGGFVKMGNTDVDLFMNNTEMCFDWGNRQIVIYVLG